MHDATSFLSPWTNFYVITGSSAAALTGLMFVVITLIAGERISSEGTHTYSTPTVVHFCAALLISLILAAPWHALIHITVLLGLVGAFGTVYIGAVAVRTRRLSIYHAQLEDWIWYSVLPFAAYVAVLVTAIRLQAAPASMLFAFAGATVMLIFIGIRNAWDVVTYLAIDRIREDDPPARE